MCPPPATSEPDRLHGTLDRTAFQAWRPIEMETLMQTSSGALSFREACNVLKKTHGTALVETVDQVLGFFLVLTPALLGPQYLPLLALLGPKNKLVKGLNSVLAKVTRRKDGTFADRFSRMQLAHTVMTYAAISEALTAVHKSVLLTIGADAPPSLPCCSARPTGGNPGWAIRSFPVGALNLAVLYLGIHPNVAKGPPRRFSCSRPKPTLTQARQSAPLDP
jgi:hypothetical protein